MNHVMELTERKKVVREASVLVSKAAKMVVNNQKDYEEYAELLKDVKTHIKKYTDRFNPIITKQREAMNGTRAILNEIIAGPREAEEQIKAALAKYTAKRRLIVEEQERQERAKKEREAQEKREAELEELRRESERKRKAAERAREAEEKRRLIAEEAKRKAEEAKRIAQERIEVVKRQAEEAKRIALEKAEEEKRKIREAKEEAEAAKVRAEKSKEQEKEKSEAAQREAKEAKIRADHAAEEAKKRMAEEKRKAVIKAEEAKKEIAAANLQAAKEKERADRLQDKVDEKKEEAVGLERDVKNTNEDREALSLEEIIPEKVKERRPNPLHDGVTAHQKWEARVINFTELVKAVAAGRVDISVLLPNMQVLNEMAGEHKRELAVPGVVSEPREIMGGAARKSTDPVSITGSKK